MSIYFKRLDAAAVLPSRGSADAAGYDLASVRVMKIQSGERAIVPTGLAVSIPAGSVGLIWPRSGLAVKHGIDVLAGVIDCDYRGEIGVVLVNHGSDPFTILVGDRIAQLLVQPFAALPVCEVSDLTKTHRGECGFGSTGV